MRSVSDEERAARQALGQHAGRASVRSGGGTREVHSWPVVTVGRRGRVARSSFYSGVPSSLGAYAFFTVARFSCARPGNMTATSSPLRRMPMETIHVLVTIGGLACLRARGKECLCELACGDRSGLASQPRRSHQQGVPRKEHPARAPRGVVLPGGRSSGRHSLRRRDFGSASRPIDCERRLCTPLDRLSHRLALASP